MSPENFSMHFSHGGSEIFSIMQTALQSKKPAFNDNLALYLEKPGQQVPSNTEKGSGKTKQGLPRILVTACIMDRSDQIQIIEEAGGRVVAADLCTGIRHFDALVEETGNPFEALAARYLNHSPCARSLDFDLRMNSVRKLANEYRVDGVVYHVLKFCDQYIWELPFVRSELEKLGIPTIHIESEYTQGSLGQSRTKLQAFIEMLKD